MEDVRGIDLSKYIASECDLKIPWCDLIMHMLACLHGCSEDGTFACMSISTVKERLCGYDEPQTLRKGSEGAQMRVGCPYHDYKT